MIKLIGLYLLVGFVLGLIVGSLDKKLSGRRADPAFIATLTFALWPVAFPLFFGMIVFTMIFVKRD